MNSIERKHPASQPWRLDLSRPVIVFVTVCTKWNRRLLANHVIHQHLLDSWQEADHWAVGDYVILPDHVHLFASPTSEESLGVRQWTNFWKGKASRFWPLPRDFTGSVWQRDAWDTQLRSGDSYQQKWEYVRENPVRHGLVERTEDWPYQGRVENLDWK